MTASSTDDPTPKKQASNPAMPHERDESGDADAATAVTQNGTREVMRRAHDDIEEGQQDTDRYATPGLEKAHHRTP